MVGDAGAGEVEVVIDGDEATALIVLEAAIIDMDLAIF